MLVTDGDSSLALLLYADGLIEWTTGDSDGGMDGLGGDPADVGFINSDPFDEFFIPDSNTSNIVNIDDLSNVGTAGLWIFQVDGENISLTGKENENSLTAIETQAKCYATHVV